MAWTTTPDFDKVVTNIRDQLEMLNPGKKFTKQGVLLFALQDSPHIQSILEVSPQHRGLFKKLPRDVRTR